MQQTDRPTLLFSSLDCSLKWDCHSLINTNDYSKTSIRYSTIYEAWLFVLIVTIHLSSAPLAFYLFSDNQQRRMDNPLKPSIQIVPLISLDSLHNTSQIASSISFKSKLSSKFSLVNMLDDRLLNVETTRRCATDRSNISTNELRKLHRLKISSLAEMSEEECLQRYAQDPFFRKKLQAELKSLKKACLSATLPSKEYSPFEIQATVRLIESEDKITYRKMKQDQTFEHLQEKGKFQRTLSRMDKKENRLPFE